MTESSIHRRNLILRQHRRGLGETAWQYANDTLTRQRTAFLIAAGFLDEAGQHELADWLLCAHPEHAVDVATGVAVHALLCKVPHAWDTLTFVGAIDIDRASTAIAGGAFKWTPRQEWLTIPDAGTSAITQIKSTSKAA